MNDFRSRVSGFWRRASCLVCASRVGKASLAKLGITSLLSTVERDISHVEGAEDLGIV